MGAQLTELTVSADFTPTMITLDVIKGVVNSICVYPTTTGVSPAFAYVELGILSGSKAYEARSAVLACGYCGRDKTIFWQGAISIENDEFIFARVSSFLAIKYRLISRITPIPKIGGRDVRIK